MGGYLVYRPSTDDKNKLPYDINGVFVNGASGAAALEAAETLLARVTSPAEAMNVRLWTTQALKGVNQVSSILTNWDGVAVETFTITIDGNVTSALRPEATQAQVQAAVSAAVAGVEGAQVLVTFVDDEAPNQVIWNLEMAGSYENTAVTVTIDTSGLTLTSATLTSPAVEAHATVDHDPAMLNMVIQGQIVPAGYRLRGAGPLVV